MQCVRSLRWIGISESGLPAADSCPWFNVDMIMLSFKSSGISRAFKFDTCQLFFLPGPTTTPPGFLLAFCFTMEYGYGVFYFFPWCVRLTASLIAPITLSLRREEFHDDGYNLLLFFPSISSMYICTYHSNPCYSSDIGMHSIKWAPGSNNNRLTSSPCKAVLQHTANSPHDASWSWTTRYALTWLNGRQDGRDIQPIVDL